MPNTTNKIRVIIMGNTRTVPPQNDIDPMKVVTQVTTSPYQGCIKTTRNVMKLCLPNKQNETTNIAIHQLNTKCHQLQLAIASYRYLRRFKSDCHFLQLARASYGYLNCYRLDKNGSKGNIGLLNGQNGTKDIASQQLATRCHQLQLVLAIYGYLRRFKSD